MINNKNNIVWTAVCSKDFSGCRCCKNQMSSTPKFFLFKIVYDCDIYFLSGGCLDFSFTCECLSISHELQVGKFMSYHCTTASERRMFSCGGFCAPYIYTLHPFVHEHSCEIPLYMDLQSCTQCLSGSVFRSCFSLVSASEYMLWAF